MKYTGEYTKEISFPLGGIGTGSIGLDGSGRLVDWEIFNRPSKGSDNSYTHFAVKAITENGVKALVLNGDTQKSYMGQYKHTNFTGFGYGPEKTSLCGLPHFKNVEFGGEFPVASLKFKDENFPADVKMTAFNPFIPCDEDNSSIPGAFFEIEIKNTTDKKIKYQTAFSVANPYKVSANKSEIKNGFHAVTLTNGEADKNSVEYGDLTVATDCKTAYTQSNWYRGGWLDSILSFWNDFSGMEPLKERTYAKNGEHDVGTVCAEIDVMPNSAEKVRFVLTWNVPNNYNYWSECKNEDGSHKTWKNYYAVLFENSHASCVYSLSNWESLYAKTLEFKESLHNTAMDKAVIDAASANLSVLKSPTVLRLEDGSFYGWEGVHEKDGSCEGTCQHVWNYAYALCFLFPKLERSIRDLEFRYNTDEAGKMTFRMTLPAGRERLPWRACLDGQMGSVIKWYREWKLSGDNKWLECNWENIKKVIEYAWSEENPDCWDRDKDGVLEGRQHHTLDMELFGPSSWLQGFYLCALKAAAEMGGFLGDTKKADEYRELYNKGKEWTKNNLFNGEYFIHKIDVTDKSIIDKYEDVDAYWNEEQKEIKYQVSEGSSIDQLLAQWHADIIGLGDIFEPEQINTALKSMMRYNYKPCMRDVFNAWRIYSLNDEAGSIICDYPENTKKPKIPVPYNTETMTGFEYSFGGLLMSRSFYDDGLKVVSAIRNRFDGKKRNPWNEFECGSNYARSMASYALIPILSGFSFDMPNKYLGFNPKKAGNFQCIWSAADSWGNFEIRENSIVFTVLGNPVPLKSFGIKFAESVSAVKIDGKLAEFTFEDGIISFPETKVTDKIEIVQ